jgi:hypothetical protein
VDCGAKRVAESVFEFTTKFGKKTIARVGKFMKTFKKMAGSKAKRREVTSKAIDRILDAPSTSRVHVTYWLGY